eukprot:m.7910 g.7910  ORF g.7910 m.7910 type:complete len:201 (-) comp6837_c1_seq1:49-651(-)
MAAPKHARLLKVLILGDGGVGKSSLMNRFVNNTYDSQSFHTIGVEFLNKEITVEDETYTMQIWDTAGQERFKSLRTPFYRGSDCCLLTFDVGDASSFENVPMWKKEFLHYADIRDPSKFAFVLLGNKCDVLDRQVSEDEALQWCRENGDMPYFETSAKDNINVERAFITAAEQLRRTEPSLKPSYETVDLHGKKGLLPCC